MGKYFIVVAAAAALAGGSACRLPKREPEASSLPPAWCRPRPASNTPHLKTTETPTQQIRQLVQCGNTMYAVGSFDTIIKGSTTYPRNNIFSFSATAPYTVTSWAPNVVGTYGTTSDTSDTLNTIAFVNGNCSGCLHRRQVHLGQRHDRAEHRRDRHHHRQRRQHVRQQGRRRGPDPRSA